MRYLVREPTPALAPFVSTLWYFEGPDLAHARERVLPNGAMQVLVNLHEDELRWYDGPRLDRPHHAGGAVVGPAYGSAIAIDTAGQRRITGIAFRPGGAPAFLHASAASLGARHVEVEDLGDGLRLRERLLEATDPEAVLDTWERILCQRVRGHLDPRLARGIERLGAGVPVQAVAREVGLSPKLFRKRFTSEVGLKPKRYARVRRLQRLLRELRSSRHIGWAGLAHACGYHDQAHLIRDFQELTGSTPTAYRARNDEDLNHVVLE